MAWELLATGTGSGTSFNSGTFTAKKYLYFEILSDWSSGDGGTAVQFGNSSLDTGGNYAYRYSFNGGADATQVNKNHIYLDGDASNPRAPTLSSAYIMNVADEEKLLISNVMDTNSAGAGSGVNRSQCVGKWDNNSEQIDIIGFVAEAGGTYSSDTQYSIFGTD